MLRPPGTAPAEPPSRRLRIGAFELDLDSRELLRPAARRGKRLTAKAQQVLVTLALRPGEVLSRELLMDAVWPDSYPTGDVLTQAIVQLRRALDDDVDAPQYIETIAKSGYRLLAEVTWVQPPPPAASPTPASAADAGMSPDSDSPQQESVAPPPALRSVRGTYLVSMRWVGVALGLLLLALALRLFWPTSSQSVVPLAPPLPPAPRLLTSHPGDERMPVPSPDGSQFVFVADLEGKGAFGLFLQALGSHSARRLSVPPEGARDDWPAWSPDGRWLAFRRIRENAAEPLCEIWQVSAVAGEARLLAPCEGRAMGIAVSADARRLIVGGRRYGEHSGLRELMIDSGEWRALPIPGPAEEWETAPRVSADGQWLLFRRGVNTADLWRVPMAGGEPEAITHLAADLRGHDWLGAPPAVVFAMVDEGGTWVWSVDSPGAPPQRLVAAGTAPRSLDKGRQLVVELSAQRYQVKQHVRGGSSLDALPAIASSRSELLPALAPDGRRLAFYSDRSGPTGLWLADSVGSDGQVTTVEGLLPMPRFAPVWSPSGSHLLVVAAGAEGEGLYEVEVATRRSRRVPLPLATIAFAIYRDEDSLLVNSREETGYAMRRFARAGGAPLSDTVLRGVGFAQIDVSANRLLYTSEDRGGLFAATLDLEDRGLHQEGLLPPPLYRAWRIVGDQLYLLRAGGKEGGMALWRLPLVDLAQPGELLLEIDPMQPVLNDLAVSRDGARVLLTGREGGGADIALVDLDAEATP